MREKYTECNKAFKNEVKSNYQILICYDNDTDDLFKYENQLLEIYNNIKFVKIISLVLVVR